MINKEQILREAVDKAITSWTRDTDSVTELLIEFAKSKAVYDYHSNDIVYLFKFNDCIYESSWATISIHKTKECAEKAMNEHKEKKRLEQERLNEGLDDDEKSEYTFDWGKDWCISESEIIN